MAAGVFLWRCGVADLHGADEADRFFGLTNLWTIRLQFSPEDWSALEPEGLRGPRTFKRDYPWSVCAFECAEQALTNVAVRFKGNSSFNAGRSRGKPPLKLDFNRGHKGRAFFGLKKLSLNNNFNDATQLREALAYDAYRQGGVPASRTAFARVYLTLTGQRTNECLGLYTLVEAVDDDFLAAHFGSREGLLLKPEGLRSLEYLGEDWRAYTNRYDPKDNTQPKDTQRFIALTRLIAEADDTTLERELPARLDLHGFLRYVALTAVLANYDSFMGNGHNYYLFQPTEGGKAVFIPWDLNEAFGGHPMAGPRQLQAELSALRPQASPNRLIERVLANPGWAAAYRLEVAAALTNACAPARLRDGAEQIARTVQETVRTESPLAWALFRRIALGQTNVVLPDRPPTGRRPGLGFGFEPGPRPDGGVPPGPGREDMPLADWITLRLRNVADELSGARSARIARLGNLPGNPAGPFRGNRPGGGGPPREGPIGPGNAPRRGPDDPLAETLFPPDLVLRHQDEIGLSATQRDFIEAALEEARPRLQEAERRVREQAEKLAALIKEEQVDMPRALAQSDQLLDLEREARRAHLELLLRIKNSLDPGQRAKLRDLKARLMRFPGPAVPE
jgi:hypothetical protein